MRDLRDIIKDNREAQRLAEEGAVPVREVLSTESVITAFGTIVPVDQEAVRNAAGIQPWSKGKE